MPLSPKKLRAVCGHALSMSRMLAKKYGYTPCNATTDEIVKAYRGKCDLCGASYLTYKRGLHMDHCHDTGRFRGWLCVRCNVMLGKGGENAELFRKAADYLETGENT